MFILFSLYKNNNNNYRDNNCNSNNNSNNNNNNLQYIHITITGIIFATLLCGKKQFCAVVCIKCINFYYPTIVDRLPVLN